MAKFLISETIHSEKVKTVRLGQTTQPFGFNDIGKAVKLTADSRYELAAAGDMIEGYVTSVEGVSNSTAGVKATVDGYTIGGICSTGYKDVVFDGLQATVGTGVVAVGDYVVVGTVTARGTVMPDPALRVTKATSQTPGAYKARVMSLGKAGTGAVGTVGVVELF